MKSFPSEVITAIQALQHAVCRLDAVVSAIQVPDTYPENYQVKILREAGREAIDVAASAFETIRDCGIESSAGDDEQAFARLKAGPLETKSKAA